MFNFEKLEVWQKAIVFADMIYSLTKSFPTDERFGLTNQIRRAADYARFVELAAGSLYEVVSQTFICVRQGLLTENDYQKIYDAAEIQSGMLTALRRSLLNS